MSPSPQALTAALQVSKRQLLAPAQRTRHRALSSQVIRQFEVPVQSNSQKDSRQKPVTFWLPAAKKVQRAPG